jgi:hypothetical protein
MNWPCPLHPGAGSRGIFHFKPKSSSFRHETETANISKMREREDGILLDENRRLPAWMDRYRRGRIARPAAVLVSPEHMASSANVYYFDDSADKRGAVFDVTCLSEAKSTPPVTA